MRTRAVCAAMDGKTYLVPDDMTYEQWKQSVDDKYDAGTWEKERKNFRVKNKSKLTNSRRGDTIKKNNDTEVSNVHYIGKINRDIFRCVTKDIKTTEVIISDTQIQHIKDRHPDDYESLFKYAKEIIEKPDYILEANKPNTAFILKHIDDNDRKYEMILRLQTSNDPDNYKNSIITFLKVEGKRYSRYLRTKKILYKSE